GEARRGARPAGAGRHGWHDRGSARRYVAAAGAGVGRRSTGDAGRLARRRAASWLPWSATGRPRCARGRGRAPLAGRRQTAREGAGLRGQSVARLPGRTRHRGRRRSAGAGGELRMTVLLYTIDDGVATIPLNRPERMNAFDEEMIDRWVDALADARQNEA